MLSLLPEGEITDPSQLPSSIPSYLIYVIPQLTLDGQVVAEGNGMQLGEELDFQYQILRRGQPGPDNYHYPVTAGSYLNVQMTGGSISPQVLQNLQARLTQTQTVLERINRDRPHFSLKPMNKPCSRCCRKARSPILASCRPASRPILYT